MSIYDGMDEEEFGRWMVRFDDALESFVASLVGDVRYALDGSPASLTAAEAWMIRTWRTPEAVDARHRAIPVDGFCRYLGEVFRAQRGGMWDLRPTPGEQLGPCVVTSASEVIRPLLLIRAALAAGTGTTLTEALQDRPGTRG